MISIKLFLAAQEKQKQINICYRRTFLRRKYLESEILTSLNYTMHQRENNLRQRSVAALCLVFIDKQKWHEKTSHNARNEKR